MLKKRIFLLVFFFTINLINSQVGANLFPNHVGANLFPNHGSAGVNTTNPDHFFTIHTDSRTQNNTERLRLLSIGKFYKSSNERNYNFSTNPHYNSVIFNGRMHDGKEFFGLRSNGTHNRFYLNNSSGEEIFKIGSSPAENSVAENYIHMPKLNSRIVIGQWGDYLKEEGYKFVINQGSALIDGNTIINGAVAIGTDLFDDDNLQENFKLSVNGSIRANRVKVYPDWADYVFENDYKLMPLDKLKMFIDINKHLPNVPSESEVLENGVDLGDVNRILLEKIEELTLHVISLSERIEKLENEKK